MYTYNFGSIFQARYVPGEVYIIVRALGREIDVINVAHVDGDLTREQFRNEVADNEDFIVDAYDVKDILTLPASPNQPTTEIDSMTTNQPAIVRILNRNGKRFNGDDYQQLSELGQYLAEQWQGVASVRLTATYCVAYDADCVAFDRIDFANLPTYLRNEVYDLNLAGVELEYQPQPQPQETTMGNQPALRMYNRTGKTITPAVVGYRQLAELGRYLAQQLPGVEVVQLRNTYAVAYDDTCVRYGAIPYASLPEHLQDAVRKLNLDGIELDFTEFA